MKSLLFVSIAVALAGCSTGPKRGYLDRDELVFGKASEMSYSEKRGTLAQTIEKMKTSPRFKKNYSKALALAKEAGRELPTIAICPIENNTGDGRSDSAATGQLYRELETAIGETLLFETIDPIQRNKAVDAAVSLANSGGSQAGVQGIGDFTEADFIMTGDLRREVTDDENRMVYDHLLNLQLHSATRTGTVLWSGTMTLGPKYNAR